MDEEMKLAKLNALYGAWSGDDGERIEATPHPKMPFKFKCSADIPAGAVLRKAK